MFLTIKKRWARFATLGCLLTVFSLGATNLPMEPVYSDCTCNAPTNMTQTGKTSTSISFGWNAVSGAVSYEVWYVRVDDNYTSPQSTVTVTSIGYTGLSAGRYIFYITTNCGGAKSDSVILEDILMG